MLAHGAVHGPRGWPFPVSGDWDVLLAARAFATGTPPNVWLETLAAHDLGLLLLARLLAIPLAAGADPVLTARLATLALGAIAAGSLAALAHTLVPAEHRPRAVLAVALLVATAAPGWHGAVVGLHASTPEATALTFLAWALAVAGPLGAAAAGGLQAFALLLSPVCAPGVLVLGALLIRRHAPHRDLVAAGSCFLAVLLVAPLFTGGSDGWIRLASSGIAAPGILQAALALPGRILATPLGWFAAITLLAAARLAARPQSPAQILGIACLLFLVMTLAPPPAYAEYPTAYRYWQPALLLAATSFAVVAAALPTPLFVAACGIPVLLFLAGPARTLAGPPDTLDEALFAAGIHRMGANPRGDHALLRALLPHAPPMAAPSLALGYGLMLGHQASRDGLTAPFDHPRWPELLATLGPHSQRGLAMGVGFGLVAPCPVTERQRGAIRGQPRAVREAVMYGIHRALALRDGPLELIVPDGEHARVYGMIGDALRASGRPPQELGPLPAPLRDAVLAGYARPGGGPWDRALVDDMHALQPTDCP